VQPFPVNPTNPSTKTPTPVTKVPFRLEPFGTTGWTVFEAVDAYEAAVFVRRNPAAAMPCWKRWEIVDGPDFGGLPYLVRVR
jgi:hypothetical protein